MQNAAEGDYVTRGVTKRCCCFKNHDAVAVFLPGIKFEIFDEALFFNFFDVFSAIIGIEIKFFTNIDCKELLAVRITKQVDCGSIDLKEFSLRAADEDSIAGFIE